MHHFTTVYSLVLLVVERELCEHIHTQMHSPWLAATHTHYALSPQVNVCISSAYYPSHAHRCSAVCDFNQINCKSPGFTLPPPLILTLIPTASSTAYVSVFFCGRPGHAGEQALPGAIHIPQVSLSLWMMFLPNYLDPEPWHQPRRTHILNALKIPATFLPELPSFFCWTTNTAAANINPG